MYGVWWRMGAWHKTRYAMKLFGRARGGEEQRRSRRAGLYTGMLLALAAIFVLSGCSSTAPSGPLAAATVNGHTIPLDDYEQVLAYAEAASSQGGPYNWQALNGRNNSANLQSQVLQFLVNLELMREALADNHVSLSAKELQVAEKQFDDNLKAGETSSDPSTQAQVKAQLPYVTGRVRYLLSEQTATEAKLISILSLWTVHLHDIIVSSKDKADELLTQLKGGADFATLATATNSTTVDGGDYGTVWYGQLPDAFTEPLFGKNPDKDTPPQYNIVAYNGEYVVVEVTDKKQQRLSTETDTSTQTTIFAGWLQTVYYDKSSHQQYVYIPAVPTQQVTQG